MTRDFFRSTACFAQRDTKKTQEMSLPLPEFCDQGARRGLEFDFSALSVSRQVGQWGSRRLSDDTERKRESRSDPNQPVPALEITMRKAGAWPAYMRLSDYLRRPRLWISVCPRNQSTSRLKSVRSADRCRARPPVEPDQSSRSSGRSISGQDLVRQMHEVTRAPSASTLAKVQSVVANGRRAHSVPTQNWNTSQIGAEDLFSPHPPRTRVELARFRPRAASEATESRSESPLTGVPAAPKQRSGPPYQAR